MHGHALTALCAVVTSRSLLRGALPLCSDRLLGSSSSAEPYVTSHGGAGTHVRHALDSSQQRTTTSGSADEPTLLQDSAVHWRDPVLRSRGS
jgi:hypothetical protein